MRQPARIFAVLSVLSFACTPAQPTGSLTGRLVLDDAPPPAGAVVTLAGPHSALAQTDAAGAFRFEALPVGSYAVVARVPSTREESLVAIAEVRADAESDAGALVFTGLGSVTGKVVLDGAPGAILALLGSSAVAAVDPAGFFELRDVRVGTYSLLVSASDGRSATRDDVVVRYAARTELGDVEVSRGPGSASGAIEGRARWSGADDHSGILVTLQGPAPSAVITGADGQYSFEYLPDGLYVVTIGADDALETRTFRIVVSDGARASAPDGALTAMGELAGQVLLPDRTQLPGTLVLAVGSSSAATTGAEGRFRLRVPAGAWQVRAVRAGYREAESARVVVARGAIAGVAPMTLVPADSNAAVERGRVVGTVNVLGEASEAGVPVLLSGPRSGVTTTDSAGRYEFTLLADGTYAVSVSIAATRERQLATGATVRGGAEATAATLVFTPLGAIAGSVVSDGAPVSGAVVALAGTGYIALTDVAGRFDLTDVPAGTWTLVANVGSRQGLRNGLVVRHGERTQVPALQLLAGPTAAGRVSGNARFTGLQSHAGIVVTLAGPATGIATTDSAGAYSFGGLPDGTYTLTFSAAASAEGQKFAPATISTGESVSVPDIAFTPVGEIEGTAILSGGDVARGRHRVRSRHRRSRDDEFCGCVRAARARRRPGRACSRERVRGRDVRLRHGHPRRACERRGDEAAAPHVRAPAVGRRADRGRRGVEDGRRLEWREGLGNRDDL